MTRHHMLAHASAVALIAATPVAAQTDAPPNATSVDEVPGEIIVTARKRQERLQDVPAVVSAVTAQRLDDLGGARAARDLVALLPGVTFIESGNGPTAEPNIRGAGQARQPNSDAAIGLYRNGAYIVGGNLGGRTFQRFDLFDTERTEVLRGPQGALYGRNAVGGAINVISRAPAFDTAGEVTVLGGSEKTYGAQGIVNLPVSETVAFRGGVDFQNQDGGFYRLAGTGKVFDASKYIAGRLGLRFRPSERFDVTVMADYGDESGDSGAVVVLPITTGSQFILPFNTPSVRSAKQTNLSANAVWTMDDFTITSVSNYRHRTADLSNDNDLGLTLSERNTFADEADTFFQELRAQGEGGSLKWLVGADLFHVNDVYNTGQSGRAIIPATMTLPAINPNYTQNTNYKQTGYSGFASLELNIIGGLSVEGEGRYSVDEKDMTIVALRADGTPRFTDFPPNSAASMPSATFNNFSYGVTVSNKFNDDFLAFARVATAYRSGGFNNDLGNPCGAGEAPGVTCNLINVPARYDEEHSINYEVGIKSSWLDRRVLLNANAYRIEYSDLLANLNNGIMPMQDPLNGAAFLANAGDARASGFEIELAVRPPLPKSAGELQLGMTLGSQKGKFKDVPASVSAVVANGNSLARLRPWSISGDFTYRVPVGGGFKFLLSGNYLYEEGGWQNGTNTLLLGNTDRLNLRAGIENDSWQLALQVRNATNSTYLTNQAGTTTNGFGTQYRRNDPRSYLATLRFRW